MLERIAALTWKHPRAVLIAAGLFAALALVVGHGVEHHLKAAGFTDPGSQSERANVTLTKALGWSADPGLVVLIRARHGGTDGGRLDLADPAVHAEVARLRDQLRKAPYVGHVVDPLERTPSSKALIAADGKSVALAAQLSVVDLEDKGRVTDAAVRRLVRSSLLDVSYAGFAPSFSEVNDQTRRDLTKAELIAFPILTILLLLVFRSVVAAAIPLVIGGLSIVGTLLVLRVMSGIVGTSLFALNITTGLGLGLAVDYALLIVSRYREEVERNGWGEQAHRRTVLTAGRTALFSGLTVAGAMLALVAMPQRFLYSVGVAGASVGVLSAVMALFVVPALLALLGARLDKLSVRRGPTLADASSGWLRIARLVMRRPVAVALGTTAVLLSLAGSLAGTTLTGPSAQAVPPGQQSYEPNHYLFDHYSRAVNEAVSLVVTGNPSPDELSRLRTAIASVPHVDVVAPFARVGGGVAYATAALDGPALSAPSQGAVRAIRRIATPGDANLLVSGNTARFIDEKHSLIRNAPLTIGLIVAFTVVLLFLLTGSALLPIKTLLMNLLTLSSTLGILVLVFQHHTVSDALSYPGPYAVEVTSLVFLFAVTFALATDYAVLVMSRIKELRDGGLPNEEAVAQGVARTGRIISAAAVMIAVVFAAFAVSPVFFMKQIAVGMALGVVIDATVVRALLVPSLMKLLGEANWWAPSPLRRLHARFGISESAPAAAPEEVTAPA